MHEAITLLEFLVCNIRCASKFTRNWKLETL